MSAEEKAGELGLDLSAAAAPVANYVACVRSGDLLFISGQLPTRPDGSRVTGKLGADVSVEEGYEAARLAAVGLLARLRAETGSLDRVRRIVKVTGFVNATDEFTEHPQVVNGASDLVAAVFGEAGRHARGRRGRQPAAGRCGRGRDDRAGRVGRGQWGYAASTGEPSRRDLRDAASHRQGSFGVVPMTTTVAICRHACCASLSGCSAPPHW